MQDNDQGPVGLESSTKLKVYLLITLALFFTYAAIYVCQAVFNLDRGLIDLSLILMSISFVFSILCAARSSNKLIKALPAIIIFSIVALRFLIYFIEYRL